MKSNLPISRLVRVSVNMTPLAAQAQNLSTLLILGDSAVIPIAERIRTYNTIAAVAADFGTSVPEYLAALLWFEQSPQPTELKIGRWAKAATKAQLIGATLSNSEQAIATWNAVTDGSFKISFDGVEVEVDCGTFAGETNLNGIATVIATALNAAEAGATCVWNATFERFEITGASTGATATISFLSAPATGTDISNMLGMRSTSSGAFVSNGVDLETPADAVADFDINFGQTWYGLLMPGITNDEHLDVSAYIEAANNKHVYGITTQEAGVLSSASTTDIAYLMEAVARKRTAVQFSSENAYAAASLYGRILTTNYNGNNTVITLMYKQEPGIVAETINETQLGILEGKKCNVFVEYNNDTAIIQPGKMSSGDFIDEICGIDWLAITIQNAVYNLLYTSPTKIPQTDEGNHRILTTIEAVCSQAVVNGLLAPGVWNSNGFGTLKPGDFIAKGFYVYAPAIASQLQADREARKSVVFQIAAKLAGAIHTVDILINVNR